MNIRRSSDAFGKIAATLLLENKFQKEFSAAYFALVFV